MNSIFLSGCLAKVKVIFAENIVCCSRIKVLMMDTKNLLHTNRTEVRKLVLEKLGQSEEDIRKDIQLLKNWFNYQKHLPELPCDEVLEIFLVVNKFNLEKCKKKVDKYYTIRKEIPELYVNKNPKLEHMKEIANVVYAIPLPKLTPTLSRITVMKFKDTNPEKYHPLNYFAHTYNILEIRVREDMMLTDTLVYDLEGLQFGHLFKLRIGILRKASAILEKVFTSRLEAIHYINLPSSMQVIVNLAKNIFGEKMRKRIHVHKDLESLHQHIPKEFLPQDFGGSEKTLDELHGKFS
ncbi:unnamed protein product [Ceutorhynchus assimilis]|uniref:CRAL-TRIO domain-containing protein n=1 Tax=Ceutorhynchus assimilis TaxID=467358 RepID=A0A9P0GRB6_9CUCU|nr:unnamed protein product [Ceutorhynchus assimilis]